MSLQSFIVNAGSKIPFFGKGRSPLLAKNHNPIVRAVNALLNITVKRSPSSDVDKVVYSDSGVSIVLGGETLGGNGSGSPLTVKEQDGDPEVENVTEIRFPNGSVTDEGGGVVSVNAGGLAYRGDWDAGEDYVVGDLVRKRSGAYQGLYIAVEDNTNSEPEFPEPVSPDWHIFALGIVATYEVTSDPSNPIKTVYVNASEGYL